MDKLINNSKGRRKKEYAQKKKEKSRKEQRKETSSSSPNKRYVRYGEKRVHEMVILMAIHFIHICPIGCFRGKNVLLPPQ